MSIDLVQESPSVGVAPPRRRWRKRLFWSLGMVTALGLVFHLAGGWYFSGVLHDRALDAGARRKALTPQYKVAVLGIGQGVISLAAGEGGNVRRPGTWGVAWPGGYGYAKDIVATDSGSVTRVFVPLYADGAPLAVGDRIEFQERAFPDRVEVVLGAPPVEVKVPGPLGAYPALLLDGSSDSWVVVLHGNGLDRLDMAKVVPAIRREGYPVLLATLRNAPGAPADPSGMLRYGAAEWEDVEAAVSFAVTKGAKDVVLVAPSMGGGATLAFLGRSALAGRVRAVVLDAPMVDFERAVDFQAARERLPLLGLPVPSSLVATAKWLTAVRYDLEWDAVDHSPWVKQLRVPVLVFHGTEDRDVPLESSRDLARARPDLVKLVEVTGAGHLSSWNVDPAAYEATLVAFLRGS